MKLRAIVCVCLAGAAALRSPRKGVVGRGDRNLAASSGDERSVRAEVGGLDQREPKERVINGVPVLTAAHCVDKAGGPVTSVVIGARSLTKWRFENYGYQPESSYVDDVVIHEKYAKGAAASSHDIALLHLVRPSKLPPVKLADTSPAIDDGVLLIGWGDTLFGEEFHESSNVLLKADLKVVNCPLNFFGDDETEFCAGDVSGKQNAGSGDSGGPLVIERDGEYYQVGVASRGDFNGYYSLYGDVAAHRDWIDDTMDNWEAKDCEDDLTTTDVDGDDCLLYSELPGACGLYDDDDFTASEQCCACGGGLSVDTTSCATYSVSGAQYRPELMGTYVASGTCDGKTLYKCEDCSSLGVELYYNSQNQLWLIGPNGCGSTSVGLYASGSGPPELASQWTEWSGSDFVEASTISVRCTGPDECADDLTTTGSIGEDCLAYYENSGACGLLDDADFTASEQCCACGGGLSGDTTSCETYSVSGAQYQTARMGTYAASGTCDGQTLYECVDCSSANEVYLYYSSKYDDWNIGEEGCGSDVIAMHTVGSNSGDLGLAQWTETTGFEWVETSTISVRCLSASYSFRPTEDGGEDASRSSSKTPLAVLVPLIIAVCLAVGIVAALLAKCCVYQIKADASAKPPRKITIELPASPSSGQAAPAEADDSDSPPHDEEQPDVITN